MYTPEPRDSKEYPNFTQTVSNCAESNWLTAGLKNADNRSQVMGHRS